MPLQFDCSACGKKVRAPDEAAGKKCRCPHCQAVIQVPDAVVEAEEVSAEVPFAPDDAPASAPADEKRRACPMCGESILATAVKCRYCGEIFDEDLRRIEKAKKKKRSGEDSDLGVAEWLFCILCSGLACIFGVVYMIQGKPKGIKMVGISFAAAVFWGVIRALIESANKP